MRRLLLLILFLPSLTLAADPKPVPESAGWWQILSDHFKLITMQSRDFHESTLNEMMAFYPESVRQAAEVPSYNRQLPLISDEEAGRVLAFVTDLTWTRYNLHELSEYFVSRYRVRWIEPRAAMVLACELLYKHDDSKGQSSNYVRAITAFAALWPNDWFDSYGTYDGLNIGYRLKRLLIDEHGLLSDRNQWKTLWALLDRSHNSWKLPLFVSRASDQSDMAPYRLTLGGYLLVEGIRLQAWKDMSTEELARFYELTHGLIEEIKQDKRDLYRGSYFAGIYAKVAPLAHEFFADAGQLKYALAFDNDPTATHLLDLAQLFENVLRQRGDCEPKLKDDGEN